MIRTTAILVTTLAIGWLPGNRAAAQSEYLTEKEPARHALVVSTADYLHLAPLGSATTDADRVAEKLRALDFKVTKIPALASVRQFQDEVLPNFRKNIDPGDLIVFYYSGHGFAYGPNNFLAPADMPLTVREADLVKAAVSLETLEYYFGQREPGLILFLIDACRTVGGFVVAQPKYPGTVLKGAAESPASMDGVNFMVGFAARPGHPALGWDSNQKLSPFTEGLMNFIAAEGTSFKLIFADISSEVRVRTGGSQHPGLVDWSSTDFYFRPSSSVLEQQKMLWLSTLATGSRESVHWFSLRHALSRHAAAARQWLRDTPEDTVASRFTHVSPVAVDRSWTTLNFKKAIAPLVPGLAFERSVDFQMADAKLLSSENLGLVASGSKSTVVTNRTLASDIEKLKAHGTAVTSARYVARAAPTFDAAEVADISIGTKMQITGVKSSQGRSSWLVASIPGINKEVFLYPKQAIGAIAPVEIGNALLEIQAPPRTSGIRDLVDSNAIDDALAEIRAKKSAVTWVSLATAQTADKEETSARTGRLAHAEYLLKKAGIDDRRITSVQRVNDFSGDGVRIRFFGH